MSSGVVNKPHLVSQVLLRGFTDGSGHLMRYDVWGGSTKLVTTEGMGFTKDLSLDDAPDFGDAWAEFENAWPTVRAAVNDGTALDEPAHVAVLRECIAVHMARSLDVLALHHDVWNQASASTVASSDAADPLALSELVGEAVNEVKQSSFSADAIIEAYADARPRLGLPGIEILTAQEGEFLVSDAPAQTWAGTEDVGPYQGISWASADAIFMPITRHHTISVGPRSGYYELSRPDVHKLNAIQMRVAHRHVAWSPGAGLSDFADAQRALRDRERTARYPPGVDFSLANVDTDGQRPPE